jgi:2-oxoglutarate dehydrogenase E1 component
MTVAFPSTPASYFHLLRRQAYASPRRPLITFTPKSMLRLKAAVSSVEDFTTGYFRPVIPDTSMPTSGEDQVDRVLLCSGKVYYDLLAERTRRQDTRTPIVRLEQLFPIDGEAIRQAVDGYPDANVVWVQEEPANQGPWPFLALALPDILRGRPVHRISRPASASPATGSIRVHQAEQAAIVTQAFDR